jgi:hypothetical protein
MTRAYLRLDPGFDERKAGYPDGPYAALVACFCLAEYQPQRGRFRSESYLKALLGRRGRHLTYLIEHSDVVALEDGRLYVDGWDEWQEGDRTVQERVERVRAKRAAAGLRRNGSGALSGPGATVSATPGATVPSVAPAHDGATVSATVSATVGRSSRDSLNVQRAEATAVGGGDSRTRAGDDADPAYNLRVWLAAHNAPIRDGDGYHTRLVRYVATDTGKTTADVIAAFERLARDGAKTAKQYVMGAEDLLFPTIKTGNGKTSRSLSDTDFDAGMVGDELALKAPADWFERPGA